jgi:hypothetical protein
MADETLTRSVLRWLKGIFWVAFAGLLVTIGNSAANYRAKSVTEIRLESMDDRVKAANKRLLSAETRLASLEESRQTQRKRNDAQDDLNRRLIEKEH